MRTEQPAGLEALARKVKLSTLGTKTCELPSSFLLLRRFPLATVQKGFRPLITTPYSGVKNSLVEGRNWEKKCKDWA